MLTDFDFPCGLWDRPDTGSRAGARGALSPQNIQNMAYSEDSDAYQGHTTEYPESGYSGYSGVVWEGR